MFGCLLRLQGSNNVACAILFDFFLFAPGRGGG